MTHQEAVPNNDPTEWQPDPEADDAYLTDEDWSDQEDDQPDVPAENVLDDWIVYPSMALGVVVTTFFPILLGQQICLPLLSAAVLIPMFLWALRQGRPRRAITLALFWVVVQSISVIVASLLFEDTASRAVQGGREYRSAWLAWSEGGPVVSLAPSLAYGRQVIELALYALAALAYLGYGAYLDTLDALAWAQALGGQEEAAATLAQGRAFIGTLATWGLWLILPLGYFGASTGAAAALVAAAQCPDDVAAVVSRGGRPDLAGGWLEKVQAPTLLVVGGQDYAVIDMDPATLGPCAGSTLDCTDGVNCPNTIDDIAIHPETGVFYAIFNASIFTSLYGFFVERRDF
jgi:hypothetical protein